MGAQGSRDFPKALAIALRARLVRIVSSALLLAPSDAGDLSSITWKKQGNVDSTETSSETSFVATSDDLTNGNYAYSEGFNVVSFKVKPNFHSTAMKTGQVGFVCDGFFTESFPGTKTFGFGTNGPFSRTMFFTNNGQSDGVDEVSLTATTEIEFKIDGGNVKISTCTDNTASSCSEKKSYAMGNLEKTSCMAKIVMSENGAGFEVKEAVTLDATITATTTATITVTNTTAAAPATTTAGPTITGTNTTTVNVVNLNGVASKALHASISWMGIFPTAMSIAAAAHIV